MISLQRGRATLIFDDGYTKVFDNVVPLLHKYRLPAVFAVPIEQEKVERTEKRPTTPWRLWLTLKAKGHEIASHSVSHRDLTALSDQELDSELREPSQKLGAHTLVYPGGAHNTAVIIAARKHYRAARTITWGLEDMHPVDPMQLKSCNFSRRNFSPRRANLLALKAWLTNKWLIETYHMVDDNEQEMEHSVRTRDLAQHLKFLVHLPIEITTVESALAQKNG